MKVVSPTEEQLYAKFSPELKQKYQDSKLRNIQQHEDFLAELKAASESERPVWLDGPVDRREKKE